MLKPAYIKGTPEVIIEQWRILEDSITGDIARRIKKTGEFTGTADLQARVLYEAGQGSEETRRKILRFMDITSEELDQIIYESGRMTYDDDRYLYSKFGGFSLPAYDKNPFAKKHCGRCHHPVTRTGEIPVQIHRFRIGREKHGRG